MMLSKLRQMSSTATASFSKFSLDFLKEKWEALQTVPNVFAYKLNIQQRRYLPGSLYFYSEYNPERSTLRRPPQTITSLNPCFNDEQFNFTKANLQEHILTVPYKNVDVTFIVNKSPLTKYHTLICPDLKSRHGQRLTLLSLDFSVALLFQLNDATFRIGYNSPGALASVNHLHLHLLHIKEDIFIDHVELTPLSSDYIFRLRSDMPTEAICWQFSKSDKDDERIFKIKEIYNFILWLCEQNRPHNLFITADRKELDVIRVFIFARARYCVVKDVQSCNIGFCELSGYVPVGNLQVYESLTEEIVLEKIRTESGTVYKSLYDYFNNEKASQY